MSEVRADYRVPGSTRKIVTELAVKLGVSSSNALAQAIRHYRAAVEAGLPKPERTGNTPYSLTTRLHVITQEEDRDWLGYRADEWNMSRGAILTAAAEYYRSKVDAGHVEARPKKEPQVTQPKKKSQPAMARPSKSPVLADRQTCSSCGKLMQVTDVDGETVLTDHMVFICDESDPRGGEQRRCPGSGKAEGRIIHGAVLDRRF